tara:strand:+ start:20289 stop:22121 length:1833 start_codon:yes stop_codon:yes gene_type:complete
VKNANNYLIKQLPKATAYVNMDYEVIHISDSWVNTFASTHQITIGINILELFPTLRQKWHQEISFALSGTVNTPKTDRYYDTNHSYSWLEWMITPWYNEEANIIGAIIQIEDVAEKILNQQKLEKLEIILSVKSEIAKIGSWEYNAITDELTWCHMTKLIHEVPPDYKPNIETAIHFYKEGVSRATITECVDQAMTMGTSWSEKLQVVTAQGKEIWIIAAGKPLFDNNKFIGIVGSFQDITEDVRNQQKTKDNEHLLRTLIDNLPLNVFIKDLDSRKILVNKSECEYLGVTDDELIGKNDFDLYDDDIAQISREEDLQIINSLEPIVGRETLNIKKDGTKTAFLTSKIPLLNENHEATGIVGFSLDITHLKQKEEELKKLVNITSLQNKKLINFAHIISHNLRSHTANFSMLLGFLIKEKDDVERENLLQMLITASDNLLETLDNLNEVVEINTNQNLAKKSIHVNTKINKIQKSLSYLIKNKKATILNYIPNTIYVKGVPTYVYNILLNIISNAVKFADPNKEHMIELSVEKDTDYTVISVKDNGLGIDLEKHKNKLFGMYKTFHQHEDSRGIGLFISKNQIDAMKGKIDVQSKVGQGTTFNIYFNEND